MPASAILINNAIDAFLASFDNMLRSKKCWRRFRSVDLDVEAAFAESAPFQFEKARLSNSLFTVDFKKARLSHAHSF